MKIATAAPRCRGNFYAVVTGTGSVGAEGGIEEVRGREKKKKGETWSSRKEEMPGYFIRADAVVRAVGRRANAYTKAPKSRAKPPPLPPSPPPMLQGHAGGGGGGGRC